jgi:hypothetical protein
MELWYPIIEKAYAQWKGSYEAIGNGGVTGTVMREVLGVSSHHSGVSEHNADRVFQLLKEAEQKGRVATAGTYGASESARYTNSGLYANHAYSIYGVVEDNGQRYVRLRNPWGQSEPGFDGKNDGIFNLELEKFAKYYSGIAISDG